MPIRFPRMHVAASVRNQILDIWDQVQEDQNAMVDPVSQPNIPNPGIPKEELTIAAVDDAVSTGGAVAPTPQAPITGAIAAGDNLVSMLDML